jgi:hypothetical protein
LPRSHAALAALVLLSACRVERTPRSFYDQRQPAAQDQDVAVAELRARVRAFGAGLERGDAAGAVSALAPTGDAIVFGLKDHEGPPPVGPEGLRRALADIDVPAPLAARTPDLTVKANLKGNLGWFSTHVEMLPRGAAGHFERLRVSGAFTRDGGEWRLSEIHLSLPAPEPPPPDSLRADSARADSARADSTRRDSAKPSRNRPAKPGRRGGRG